MKEENRRVKMTKKLIKEAYLDLLENTPFEKIFVTDICKEADVNRSTFYAYYEDPIMIRKEIENDVFDQIPVFLETIEDDNCNKQLINELEKFFAYVQNNSRLFQILITRSSNNKFNTKLIETVLSKYHVESLEKNSFTQRFAYYYCVNGMIGILSRWIEEDFPVNSKEIAEFALELALSINALD